MAEITIDLRNLVIGPDAEETHSAATAPEEMLKRVAVKLASIRGLGTALAKIEDGNLVISAPDVRADRLSEAARLFDRAMKHANNSDHRRAISVLQLVLDIQPLHQDARRNLAMAFLESGDVASARKHLREVLFLYPQDAWAWVLLANISAKVERDQAKALRMYDRARILKPDDPTLLTNLGATLANTGRDDSAAEMFEAAIHATPSFPNSYCGLALLQLNQGRAEQAVETLESMFRQPEWPDQRALAVYAEARAMYLKASRQVAVSSHASAMEIVESLKALAEDETCFPIEFIEDNALDVVQARTELAWNHDAKSHVVRHVARPAEVVPHLLAHELLHIRMEHEARLAGRNRRFATSPRSQEFAMRTIGNHAVKLQKRGFPEDVIKSYMQQLVNGLAARLYNAPLDMVVEERLFGEYPQLRVAQITSLALQHEKQLPEVTDEKLRELSPRIVYNAAVAVNGAVTLFVDELFGNKTRFSKDYERSDSFPMARKLFSLWQHYAVDPKPGDQYDLVDQFANALGLSGWFEWVPDTVEGSAAPANERKQSVTNPDLLKSLSPAATFYCLSALERFEKMPRVEVFKVAREIALRGAEGIDYSSSESDYQLNSLPGESFTGLQVLCLMYVAFKLSEPTLDIGFDLGDAYQAALKLHGAEENGGGNGTSTSTGAV